MKSPSSINEAVYSWLNSLFTKPHYYTTQTK